MLFKPWLMTCPVLGASSGDPPDSSCAALGPLGGCPLQVTAAPFMPCPTSLSAPVTPCRPSLRHGDRTSSSASHPHRVQWNAHGVADLACTLGEWEVEHSGALRLCFVAAGLAVREETDDGRERADYIVRATTMSAVHSALTKLDNIVSSVARVPVGP